jgi:hypothetical protein
MRLYSVETGTQPLKLSLPAPGHGRVEARLQVQRGPVLLSVQICYSTGLAETCRPFWLGAFVELHFIMWLLEYDVALIHDGLCPGMTVHICF